MHSNIVAAGFVIRSWNCLHKRANLFNRKRQFKRYTKLNLKKVHWPRYNWGSGPFHYVDDEDNPEVVHCWWPKNAITATSAFTDHEYNSMRLRTNAYRHATNIILKIAFLFQLNFTSCLLVSKCTLFDFYFFFKFSFRLPKKTINKADNTIQIQSKIQYVQQFYELRYLTHSSTMRWLQYFWLSHVTGWIRLTLMFLIWWRYLKYFTLCCTLHY